MINGKEEPTLTGIYRQLAEQLSESAADHNSTATMFKLPDPLDATAC